MGDLHGQAATAGDTGLIHPARRARWWLLAGLVSMLVLVAGLGLGANAPDVRQALTPVVSDDPASWRPALGALLDRRMDAVRRHDEAAFMADVDRSDATFVRRQRDQYQNLVGLNLAKFDLALLDVHRYSLLNDYTVPGDEAALVRRFTVVGTLRVTVRYAIEGLDGAPVAVPWVPVVGYSDRGWVLAGESDDKTLPVGTGGQPWDGGPNTVTHAGNVTMVVTRGRDDIVQRLLPLAEESLAEVLSFRPDGWSGKILIIAVDDPAVFAAYFRRLPGEFAAANQRFFASVPDWDPSYVDHYVASRVLLNPKYADGLSKVQLKPVLVHEMVHAALGGLTSQQTPIWLQEGVANLVSDPFEYGSDAAVAALVGKIGVPSALPVDDTFFVNSDNYHFAWLACRMIAEQYGRDRLMALYVYFVDHSDVDGALRQTLGLTSDQLLQKVQAYIRKLGGAR
jgi:hypothetical protein